MVYDLDTKQERSLGVQAQNLAWHPQGSKILYGGWDGKIYEVNPDGTGNTAVTTPSEEFVDFAPSYSSTGRKIAFTRWPADNNHNGDIYVKDFDKNQEQQITPADNRHHQAPVWVRSGVCAANKSKRPSAWGPEKDAKQYSSRLRGAQGCTTFRYLMRYEKARLSKAPQGP